MSQSLGRALELLNRLAEKPASLDELSSRADVHKTTVMRLLRTLEEQAFVVRDSTNEFQLGRKFFELSTRALEQRDLRRIAAPFLRKINDSTGHTVHLAMLEGQEVVYIDKYESRHPVRMYSRIGLTAALHSAAVAKAIMADMRPEEQDRLIEGIDFVQRTENTITTPEGLREELRRVAAQGWAQDRSEHESMVHCIAAPIRDASSRVVGAASFSVPVVLLPYEELLDLLPTLVSATKDISQELGCNTNLKDPR